MKKVAIFGTGGNCLDILDVIMDINAARGERVYDCIGFFDDDPAKKEFSFFGAPVLGPLGRAKDIKDCSFVFGIGSTSNHWKRHEIFSSIGLPDERYETIVHPTASVSASAVLGRGSVVFQNSTITTNVVIGRHVSILPNSVISHDSVIGDFSLVAGGVCVSGNVHIGRNCYIGTNSALKEGVRIGDGCLVGMGSVLLEDMPTNSIYVGNPARSLRPVQPDASTRAL